MAAGGRRRGGPAAAGPGARRPGGGPRRVRGSAGGAPSRVKAVLTDQSALAGLGTLLADEVLWRAGVTPARRASDLTEGERRRLYTGMRRALRSTVPGGRVPARDTWLTGHRDAPDPHCPRGGGPLRRSRPAGRGTVWCPRSRPEDGPRR
ncbi:hypothetical protein [Streptomyces composti]|uniref:hypothetical protein n=1 Tax=Streptomyces composti TaxID=2720025 RepID=UPI0028109D8F|nr:hypothetical protein [Streptomyces composti]